MKKDTFKVRGYEVKHNVFEKLEEVQKALGDTVIVQKINAQLSAHDWNSNFEQALVDKALAEEVKGEDGALKKKYAKLIERGEDGKIVSTETNANFLKRIGYSLTPSQAQDLADTIAFPPVSKPRGEKVDKDLVERMQMAEEFLSQPEKLERLRKKVEASNSFAEDVSEKIEWPDLNGDTTEEEDVAMVAEVIRLYRLAV